MSEENKKVDEATNEEDVILVDSYEELNVKELKEDLDERKIKYPTRAKKTALIELLEANDEANDEGEYDENDKNEGGERPKVEDNVDPASVEDPENPDQAEGSDAGAPEAGLTPTTDALEQGSENAPLKDEKKAVDIIKGNEYIRTYSAETHPVIDGRDWKAQAKEFTAKVSGREMIDADKIKHLSVNYRVKSKKLGVFYNKVEEFVGPNMKNESLNFIAQLPQRASVLFR